MFFDGTKFKIQSSSTLKSEFGELVNPKVDFHFREAKVQGLEPQDFAKVVVTLVHFVERAATNYPLNEVHPAMAMAEKPSKE